MTKFIAKNVMVLRFTDKVDQQGMSFPPQCHAVVPSTPVSVTFNHQGSSVGKATLKRVGNKIMADIEVFTAMKDTLEAFRLMRLLTPSIEGKILDAYEDKVLGIQLYGLSLCSGPNADDKIKPLGDAVQCASPSTKAGLH